MKPFEHPQGEGAPASQHSEAFYQDVLDTQLELMRVWAQERGLEAENDAVAEYWLKSGLGLKFREYIEIHPEMLSGKKSDEELEQILEEVKGVTLH